MSVLYFWLARHGPPEEAPTCWYQVFGVVNGKLVPYGAPLDRGGWMKMFTAMLTSFSANVPYHFHITKPSSWAHWAETTLA